MLIIYFLFGLGVVTAHSDHGVLFRAQNFDETVKPIDKEAYLNHHREKRLVTGYFVPQNITNRPTWGSNSSREFVANVTRFMTNGTRPSSAQVFYPGQPGYVAPSSNTGTTFIVIRPNGTLTNTTQGYINPGNYNNFTRPVYPTYLTNATSNSSGYPVRPVSPPYTPYPGYPGYPAPNAVYPPPNNVSPAPNNVYPVPNSVSPAPNSVYPAPNNVYPVPNNVYPKPNNVYPVAK
ncbi:hypothetical protein PYW08_012883 [Mythimna loreyi]|uniref:Uncharacterized protein n=1 Tax=Mythimna loreyi TaxID=667449 RepID=A0ACC2Q475_9NEOP|nr:hypothetical protein PYW08_012883 [Mythimna loreyi]